MKTRLTVLLIFAGILLNAQDTLRIMHYNLLNYGNNYGDCNSSNNNVNDKNGYLKKVVEYLQPALLTVNEIDDNVSYHDYLLENVFNMNGVNRFKRCNLPNLSGSPIMNQLFYDTAFFSLLSTATVETNYRDIDIITLRYKGGAGKDSIALNCIVAHLKAGSEPSDAQERAGETFKLMNYLDVHGLDGNYLLSGDLNLYSGSESAFQNLLLFPNAAIRFFDPISKVGEWHANDFFSDIHTQSTHLTGDCFSGGGMDDRFDFILTSEEVLNGTDGVQYVPSSYQAIGQDGLRFDQTLIDPVNNSVPPDVLQSLYAMSDHLPVVLDLKFGGQTGGVPDIPVEFRISFKNPASGQVPIIVTSTKRTRTLIRLTDQYGRTCWSREIRAGEDQNVMIPAGDLAPGLYFLRASSSDGMLVTRKLIISR